MSYRIGRVAVLGAGTMGSQIAAHLANAQLEVLLLDIVPGELTAEESARGLSLSSRQVRNRIARAGLESAKRLKPPAFFSDRNQSLITLGNFDDDLSKVAEVDWVIEAVLEDLQVKRALYSKLEQVRRPGTIVSSNTSGIPIRELGAGMSEDFRKHFLGTHFFNPPRYLKLLEVIPTEETLPEVTRAVADFCDRVLGKGIVYAKDTPNFIANRIATFSTLNTVRLMLEGRYTVEEIDALTGPLIGRPKSATFRTLDMVGLDVALQVADNLYRAVPHDERRDVLRAPDFLREMVRRGLLGNKTGAGFYKKVDQREYWVIDYETLEYRPQKKANFASVAAASSLEDTAERIRALLSSDDRAGEFLWKLISENLLYAASRIPEISDDIVNIDNAIKWGFGHEMGPFELWDEIGLPRSVERMQGEGKKMPPIVEKLLGAGKQKFYHKERGRVFYFDLRLAAHRELEPKPGIIILKSLKDQNKVIKSNAAASIIDIGDGVICLEFHSKMNAIGPDTITMMNAAVREASENFEALVIANQGENFSVGANLALLLMAAEEGEWDEIDASVRSFQRANMSLRYSPKPVVVAPHGMALGGGCEITMHGDRARAAAETYLGLVEVGAGLIPAGGGVKELLLRSSEGAAPDEDLFPRIKRLSEMIAMGKVSSSAVEARQMWFLRESDGITMNRDRLIEDAKQEALAMARAGYRQPHPRNDIPVLGEGALAALKLAIHMMLRGGYITEYDAHVARKLAYVITGGDLSRRSLASEQQLLDLEREAFVSLCGEPKTRERMKHLLRTGKPLRN